MRNKERQQKFSKGDKTKSKSSATTAISLDTFKINVQIMTATKRNHKENIRKHLSPHGETMTMSQNLTKRMKLPTFV